MSEAQLEPDLKALERQALEALLGFPLTDALFGRRSRRFALGGEVPEGPLTYRSRYEPLPLSELERLLILTTVGGLTGWHNLISHHARVTPYLPSYSGMAAGRTFPSAAGFHTSQIFFTDDSGTYTFQTRDAAPPVPRGPDGRVDLVELLFAHRQYIHQLSQQRLYIPPKEPFMAGHNAWNANKPGSLLVWPVADVAQHQLLKLLFIGQNGFVLYDDIHQRSIPGLEKFSRYVAVDKPYPLTAFDQATLAEVSAEISTAVFAGHLMQQAMGLGGWMLNGLDRVRLLGASGDPAVPGLGFRYDFKPGWSRPNPTGLEGVFEGFCPPHYPSMRHAVEALVTRKYQAGGPFHPATPGPWKDSPTVRAQAFPHEEWLVELVALQAQYIFDTFGKFPATVPTIYTLMFLQSHHLDLEYYDRFFQPGAYLQSHAEHLEKWHGLRLEDLPRR
ncbi:hypothetical protein [Meiothermus rufus]|uniref:hypothetical protein n=1 Tax=Meiothermus rufus TaxID=604332 RepID=UPI000400F2E7|nr:hypothetical protein [Meiothermus rufus]